MYMYTYCLHICIYVYVHMHGVFSVPPKKQINMLKVLDFDSDFISQVLIPFQWPHRHGLYTCA